MFWNVLQTGGCCAGPKFRTDASPTSSCSPQPGFSGTPGNPASEPLSTGCRASGAQVRSDGRLRPAGTVGPCRGAPSALSFPSLSGTLLPSQKRTFGGDEERSKTDSETRRNENKVSGGTRCPPRREKREGARFRGGAAPQLPERGPHLLLASVELGFMGSFSQTAPMWGFPRDKRCSDLGRESARSFPSPPTELENVDFHSLITTLVPVGASLRNRVGGGRGQALSGSGWGQVASSQSSCVCQGP